jgi:hypothetical protein
MKTVIAIVLISLSFTSCDFLRQKVNFLLLIL